MKKECYNFFHKRSNDENLERNKFFRKEIKEAVLEARVKVYEHLYQKLIRRGKRYFELA